MPFTHSFTHSVVVCIRFQTQNDNRGNVLLDWAPCTWSVFPNGIVLLWACLWWQFFHHLLNQQPLYSDASTSFDTIEWFCLANFLCCYFFFGRSLIRLWMCFVSFESYIVFFFSKQCNFTSCGFVTWNEKMVNEREKRKKKRREWKIKLKKCQESFSLFICVLF